uniref:Uncharacterized protein n=1 Tax=Amphiprion percula TaxID=161767 RepID=A0A3P8TPE8_AMPPE
CVLFFPSFSHLHPKDSSSSVLCGSLRQNVFHQGTSHLRSLSSWIVPRTAATPQISRFLQLPWQYQQVWTRKGGTEYQTKNIKCNRTHSYIKRVSSHGGIKVPRNHSHIKGSFWKPVRLSRNRCWF